jgi:hypothetical protein
LTSFASQALSTDEFVKGVDFADVASDAVLGPGASAIFDGAVDFKPFSSSQPLSIVGYNKSFTQAGFEAGSYYLLGKGMDRIGAINGTSGYHVVTHGLQINLGSGINNVIGIVSANMTNK